MTFDYSHNWGSGSSESSTIAVQQDADNAYSLLVKHVNTNGTESYTDWEIVRLNPGGVINWSETIWTSDIAAYENYFGEELDGQEGLGINVQNFLSVTPTAGFGGEDLTGCN